MHYKPTVNVNFFDCKVNRNKLKSQDRRNLDFKYFKCIDCRAASAHNKDHSKVNKFAWIYNFYCFTSLSDNYLIYH